MGDLSVNMVNQARAFANVAIDFGGPFYIKNSFCNNRKLIKAYLCLFVCQVTKAIHVELVTDLTVQNVINELCRFVSNRRGGSAQGQEHIRSNHSVQPTVESELQTRKDYIPARKEC